MELDLKDYIKVVRKRIWMIVIFVLVACITTAVVSLYFIQPTYEAYTKLIVNKSEQKQGLDQLDINTVNLNIRLIDTYKEVIKTPRIMDNVVKEHPELGLTTEKLIDKVKISSVNNTQVMTLVVQDKSYDKAAAIVNAVSEVFQREIPLIMNVDNVSLLNEAKPMDKPIPVKPNVKLNIAISFVVSLMIAVGLSFLLEYLDDTIKTEEDVRQYLNLPTLAMISRIREEDLVEHFRSASQPQAGEISSVTVNR